MQLRPLVLAIACLACRGPTTPERPASPPPPPPPEQRISNSLRAWGEALQRRDKAALDRAEDIDGRLALVYVGTKALASETPDGAQAVEHTLSGNLFLLLLQSMFPGLFGPPQSVVFAVVPTGDLGPGLVEAGLAERHLVTKDGRFALVPLPWKDTIGRVQAASARHRDRLAEREAWTCELERIEHVIPPTEPTLVRAAAISRTVFAGWLATVDAIWVVRTRCASGPGVFVVAGHVERDGRVHDRILLAHVGTAPGTVASPAP